MYSLFLSDTIPHMSYSGKLDLKQKAIAMRKQGLSVGQIQQQLQVSKSSISIWTRHVLLSSEQSNMLRQNQLLGGRKGALIAAKNKIRQRERLTSEIITESRKDIGKLTRRDRFVVGISLYFAEGTKVDKSISFTNSDMRAVLFIKNWITEFLDVPLEKFHLNLYIHDNLDEQTAISHWSSRLDIPISQFGKSYVVKNNLNRFRKTKHENGIVRLTVSDVNKYRKIIGWISGIFDI